MDRPAVILGSLVTRADISLSQGHGVTASQSVTVSNVCTTGNCGHVLDIHGTCTVSISDGEQLQALDCKITMTVAISGRLTGRLA